MGSFFNTILVQPIFNILILFYDFIPGKDFGVAIIVLTVVIRLILSPLSIKALRSQRELGKIQPKIKEINEKYKNDKQAAAKATMELYKEHGVSPFTGCLPLLIQIPILIALYSAFRSGLNPAGISGLYPFVPHPGIVNNDFLGFINLSARNAYLAITAGVAQWFQSRLASKNVPKPAKVGSSSSTDLAASMMNKQMLYFLPVMIIIIAWGLPAGLVIYWVATTIFSIFEQWYISRKYPLSAIN